MSTKNSPEAPARRASERRGGGEREPAARKTRRGGVLLVHDLGFTVLLDEERFRQDGRSNLEGQGLRVVPEIDEG